MSRRKGIGGIYVVIGFGVGDLGTVRGESRRTSGLIAVEGLGFTGHGEPEEIRAGRP